jgi:catechol 2,3-dioxygenase
MGTHQQPTGPFINHLVLTVRDLAASEQFYTEKVGFEKCGELGPDMGTKMSFFRGHASSHHDLALVQVKDVSSAPPVAPTSFENAPVGINHIAIGYPSREEWLERLKTLQERGVEFLVRGNHGMTHSAYFNDPDGNFIEVVYDVPAEVWKDDVNAALNYFEVLPTTGEDTLQDSVDYHPFVAS